MDFECLLLYAASCILGGLLSWLIFGFRSKDSEAEINLKNLRDSNATILGDFNTYRTDTKAKIYTKDAEISLLKKKLEEIKRVQSNGNNHAEVEKWKRQAKSLEKELIKNPNSGKSESKLVSDLRAQLDKKNKLLKEKEDQLKKSQGSPAKFNTKFSQLQEEEIRLLAKQLGEQKKKVKKLKKSKGSTSELELKKLLRQLDKRKKKKKKSKKKKGNPNK